MLAMNFDTLFHRSGEPDLIQFVYRTSDQVLQGRLRVMGRLNGRGRYRLIDPATMNTFCFHYGSCMVPATQEALGNRL